MLKYILVFKKLREDWTFLVHFDHLEVSITTLHLLWLQTNHLF